jgi:hypothetical protein
MSENNYLNKKFPQFCDELNKIDFLVLTFSLCVSLYSRLSYTAIGVKVGEEIIYLNYKLKYNNKVRKQNAKNGIITISYDDYKNSLNINVTKIFELGDFFMSILQRFPHEIFNRRTKLDSYFTKEPYLLELNKEFLDDVKANLIINPNTLPMICKPRE